MVSRSARARQTWSVTTDQTALICADPREEIIAEYPGVTIAGVRAAAAYGAALAREGLLPLPQSR